MSAEYKFPLTDDQLTALRPLLYAIAKNLTRCSHTRDDLVAEAYLRLVSKSNWIDPFVAARTAMQDFLRVKGRKDVDVADLGDEGVWTLPGREAEPIDHLVAAETAALEGVHLNPLHRRIMETLMAGATHDEAAEAVGVTKRTVRQAVRRFKDQLKEKETE